MTRAEAFIADVAARRGCAVAGGPGGPWRLVGDTAGSAWAALLIPESLGGAAEIRWRCAALRMGAEARPRLAVLHESSAVHSGGVLGPGWTVVDPDGVLDTALAPLFTKWPHAWWGAGDERPARLDEARLTGYGLDLVARGWWGSAPALDQLITLGAELADRLRRTVG